MKVIYLNKTYLAYLVGKAIYDGIWKLIFKLLNYHLCVFVSTVLENTVNTVGRLL